MNELQKINWVASHRGASHFEKDLELFKKTFPSSPIIGSLESILPFQKQEFDERMLTELVCAIEPSVILNNRKGKEDTPEVPQTREELDRFILSADIEKLPYQSLKDMVVVLALEPENRKKLVLISSLAEHKAHLTALVVAKETEEAEKEAQAAKETEEAEKDDEVKADGTAKKNEGQD